MNNPLRLLQQLVLQASCIKGAVRERRLASNVGAEKQEIITKGRLTGRKAEYGLTGGPAINLLRRGLETKEAAAAVIPNWEAPGSREVQVP